MLGFFSKEKDNSVKVKKDEIYFVSCADKLTSEQVKMNFSKLALTFANKFNLNKVYLYFGKEIIEYEFEV